MSSRLHTSRVIFAVKMRTGPFLLLFVLIVCIGFCFKSSASSANPPDRSFRELVSERERLDGKRVSVIGYLDAQKTLLIANPQSTRDSIAIDLTAAQRQRFKRFWRAGYVRIVGKFEYVGSQKTNGPIKGDPEHRILVLSPAGFGTGGYTMRLTKITKITSVSPPHAPAN
jgi:hypothetical protein